MDINDEQLESFHERFTRDHQRLREELLVALPASPLGTSVDADRLQWLKQSGWPRRIVGAAASLLLAATVWFVIGNGGSDPIAYARILEQLGKARSVQYTITMTSGGKVESVKRVMILGRYLQRQEHLDTDGIVTTAHVFNYRTGKIVAIDMQGKKFVVLARQRIAIEGEPDEVRDIKPAPSADIYETIMALPADSAELLPSRMLDGKKVIGFYAETKKGQHLWKRTFWVEEESMLPVRVETSFSSTHPMWGAAEWVRDNFVYDTELSTSLFSTDPPEGYTVKEGEIQGIRMP